MNRTSVTVSRPVDDASSVSVSIRADGSDHVWGSLEFRGNLSEALLLREVLAVAIAACVDEPAPVVPEPEPVV